MIYILFIFQTKISMRVFYKRSRSAKLAVDNSEKKDSELLSNSKRPLTINSILICIGVLSV